MVSADAVRPSRPTKLSSSALACKLVQLRVESALLESNARPNSAFVSFRPIASSVPPFSPTKALTLLPPMASIFVCTTSPAVAASAPARCTSLLDDSTVKLPFKLTKLKRLISSVPMALVSSPNDPSLSSVTVASGPASTSSWRPL